jgi:hypothetical protein
MVEETWSNRVDWLMQCDPETALLLLIREYLFGPEQTEARLRKLIPGLALYGEPSTLLQALSPLDLITLETCGSSPDSETPLQQI